MKENLLIAAFVLLVCAAAFSAAVSTNNGSYDPETGEAIIDLKPGWNLVPYGASGSEQCQLGAIWIWVPTVGRYYGGRFGNTASYSRDLLQAIESDDADNYLYAQGYGPFAGGHWVYSANECQVTRTFAPTSAGEGIDGMKLAEGWNFVTISPWMKNKKLSDFMGECELLMIASWDSRAQAWASGTTTEMEQAADMVNEGLDTGVIGDSSVGDVYLLKAVQACTLGLKDAFSPPELPQN